jgi:hypothetical protein
MWQIVDYMSIPERDVFVGLILRWQMSDLIERLCFLQFGGAFVSASFAF